MQKNLYRQSIMRFYNKTALLRKMSVHRAVLYKRLILTVQVF